MKIVVKNTNAKMESFEVPVTTSIMDLKNMYVERLKTGENPEELYFTYSGNILRNDYTLEEYGIKKECIFYCVYRAIPEEKK